MSRCALRVCAFLTTFALSLGSHAQLLGDTVAVNASTPGFVTYIDGTALIVEGGTEFPAPGLAPDLDVSADLDATSMRVTIMRSAESTSTLFLSSGVIFTVQGVDRIVTGVTHNGGSLIIDNISSTDRSFTFRARSADGDSFQPGVVWDAQFQIATAPRPPSLLGDVVTVNAGLVGFVTLINSSATVVDPGIEFPAPSLAENLHATADFGSASLAVTMTRRNFATLSHPPGVVYTVTGIDRRVTGVTHTGGNAIIEGLTFNNSGFQFTAKTPGGLFPTDVTFTAQFSIATEATAPDVDALQCRESAGGALGQCTFNTPMGVVARNGNVYVADTVSHAVYRIDSATQQKVLVAGLQLDPQDAPDVRYNGDGIDARQALLNNPTGLALDDAGNLYIADTGNHAIRRVAADGTGVIPEGAIIMTVAGVPTQFGVDDPLLLFGPRGITVDEEGNLFIADTMNQQIRKRAADGTLSVLAGVAGLPGGNNGPVTCIPPCATPPARFNKPVGVAVDSSGRVFVADEGNNRIRMVSVSDGFVGSTTTANPLRRPTAIVLSPGGANTLLAADYGNHVIRQVAPCDDCSSPTPDVVAGTGSAGSSGASLNSPIGISVDGFTLYIADLVNQRIGKVPLSD